MDTPVQKFPESPALLLDASASNVLVGIWGDGRWLAFQEGDRCEALESIFTSAKSVLKAAKLALKEISSFIYCEGPGSVLSIRISAMALRTWQNSLAGGARPIYAYQSLRASAFLLKSKESHATGLIMAPSRMGYWNILDIESSETAVIREIKDATTLSGNIYFLDQRGTTEVPIKTTLAPYDLQSCPELLMQDHILKQNEEPNAWLPLVPEYKKWDPVRHKKNPKS